jgi:DtxR family transcriptional regulator, manganese transport regulator
MRGQHPQRRIDEDRQAAPFRCAREAHQTEVAEDYVELIAELCADAGGVRGVDLARRLEVTRATVASMVARLRREGLVEAEPYRAIFLTEEGRKLAERCRRRHEVVLAILRSIGVSEAAALRDAEGIEHHVGEETLAALERLVRRSDGGPPERKALTRAPRR